MYVLIGIAATNLIGDSKRGSVVFAMKIVLPVACSFLV